MGRRRELLHINKVEEFAEWAGYHNYLREPTVGEFEILRLRLYSRSGTNPPLIFYKKMNAKEHVTCFGDGTKLVKLWLVSRKMKHEQP